MTCSCYVKREMLGVRFTEKVLPVVSGWVSGSVVTWMIMDNNAQKKKSVLNKTTPCQLCEKTSIILAAPETNCYAVPSQA